MGPRFHRGILWAMVCLTTWSAQTALGLQTRLWSQTPLNIVGPPVRFGPPVGYGKGAPISLPEAGAPNVPDIGGETETITDRYPSGKIKTQREVVQDRSRNYMNHGLWKSYDQTGEVIAEGEFRYGVRHGLWRRVHSRQNVLGDLFTQAPYTYFQSPFVSIATFDKGKLHGEWIIEDRNGRKISQWKYVQGNRHGEWTWYFPTGAKMQSATYNEGVLDGDFVQWQAEYPPSGKSQLLKRTVYQDGRKIERKTAAHAGSGTKRFEITYLSARLVIRQPDDWWNAQPAQFTHEGREIKHGPATYWHASGERHVHGYYEHGQPEGEFTWWRTNGQRAVRGGYRVGQPHGAWTWWRENGVKHIEGRYAEGQAVGSWLIWNAKGEFVKEVDAEKGKILVDAPTPGQIPTPIPDQILDTDLSPSADQGIDINGLLNR